jgi:hypothetical protein
MSNVVPMGVRRAANSAPLTPYNSDKAPIPTQGAESAESVKMPLSDDLADVKLKLVAAEADVKLARFEGKLDTLGATMIAKMDALQNDQHRSDTYNRDTRLITIATIVASALALAALMWIMATYGDAMFGRGMNVRDLATTIAKEQIEATKRLEAVKPQK